MTIKQQINYGAIQKVCHFYNEIFHSIDLCHTLLILHYHFPLFIKNNKQWNDRLFFVYMATLAYHAISKEVENRIFKPW